MSADRDFHDSRRAGLGILIGLVVSIAFWLLLVASFFALVAAS